MHSGSIGDGQSDRYRIGELDIIRGSDVDRTDRDCTVDVSVTRYRLLF